MVNPLSVDPGITMVIDPVRASRDLFDRYHEAIFVYLYRLLGDRESANDLTQEAFVKIYETRNRLLGIENRRAWVYVTAYPRGGRKPALQALP